MFLIRNFIKNIARYKRKYITFGVLFFVLITTASICAGIYIRMGAVTDNILREYAGVSTLLLTKDDPYIVTDRLSKEQFMSFRELDEISDVRMYRYNFNSSFLKDNIPPLDIAVRTDADGQTKAIGGDIFVLGYNTSLLHFAQGVFDLESGRVFESDEECVIAKNSKNTDEASLLWNALEIGDTITVDGSEITASYTVVGIKKEDANNDEQTNRRVIYTTIEAAEIYEAIAPSEGVGLHGFSYNTVVFGEPENPKTGHETMGYEAMVYLESPENFRQLNGKKWGIDIGGYTGCYLNPLFTDFESIYYLTYAMQQNGFFFMIISAFIICFVTCITTIIMLGSRKYEIGVLRSAGMKKSRLIASYIVENLAFIWGITIVSLIIAQLAAPAITAQTFDGLRSFVSPEMFANLTGGANLNYLMRNIALVLGGTTGIVALSLIFACVNVVRYEPLKIFNKRY